MTQGELLPVEHRSYQQNRLKKFARVNPERLYAARWKRLMRQRLSSGATYLEMILAPNGGPVIPYVSRRDAAVAASVIQWLGTNCGCGFLWACERELEEARQRLCDDHERRSLVALRRDYDAARDAARANAPRPLPRAIAINGRLL